MTFLSEHLDNIIMFGVPIITFVGMAGYGCWRYMKKGSYYEMQEEYYRNLAKDREEREHIKPLDKE